MRIFKNRNNIFRTRKISENCLKPDLKKIEAFNEFFISHHEMSKISNNSEKIRIMRFHNCEIYYAPHLFYITPIFYQNTVCTIDASGYAVRDV